MQTESLARHGHFAFAPWDGLQKEYPEIATILSTGADSEVAAQARYESLMISDPRALASLLQSLTAGEQIELRKGTLCSYVKQIEWNQESPEWAHENMRHFSSFNDTERVMRHDRFWAWAQVEIVDEVRLGQLRHKIGAGPRFYLLSRLYY